ncbi:hypothetical protein ANN_20617 [Periplaneta americana]|uniref:Uncharacterized protein n=1 Tax=Periplaneta americana TaxID=6978 RepID=A0ABQ8SDD3_PERAM|nr:hypothetical protein ANN_20617 [Periplaneta americana]
MAGLCEGGNEPPGSLKASNGQIVATKEQRTAALLTAELGSEYGGSLQTFQVGKTLCGTTCCGEISTKEGGGAIDERVGAIEKRDGAYDKGGGAIDKERGAIDKQGGVIGIGGHLQRGWAY